MRETGFSDNQYQNPAFYILTDLWHVLEMTTIADKSVKDDFTHELFLNICIFQTYRNIKNDTNGYFNEARFFF